MKNLSLILNAILFVAVAILYFLHFSSGKETTVEQAASSASDIKIAYINSDSVLKYYDYYNVNVTKLEDKGKKLDQDFRNRAESFQSEVNAYQRNLGNMTIGQAKAAEEELGKKQQNLQLYQRSLEQQIMEEQAKMTEELYNKITSYLKTYGEKNGLQVVLKYNPTSDLLYGGSTIDITQDVIKGLNEAFKAEKDGPIAKKDSTSTK